MKDDVIKFGMLKLRKLIILWALPAVTFVFIANF